MQKSFAKGSKTVYNIVDKNEKENLTALVTGNAVGQLAPTLILFAYERIPSHFFLIRYQMAGVMEGHRVGG